MGRSESETPLRFWRSDETAECCTVMSVTMGGRHGTRSDFQNPRGFPEARWSPYTTEKGKLRRRGAQGMS